MNEHLCAICQQPLVSTRPNSKVHAGDCLREWKRIYNTAYMRKRRGSQARVKLTEEERAQKKKEQNREYRQAYMLRQRANKPPKTCLGCGCTLSDTRALRCNACRRKHTREYYVRYRAAVRERREASYVPDWTIRIEHIHHPQGVVRSFKENI